MFLIRVDCRSLAACTLLLLSASPLKAGVPQDFVQALRLGNIPQARVIFLQQQNESSKALESALARDGPQYARSYHHAVEVLQPQLKNWALSEIVRQGGKTLATIHRDKERGRREWRKGRFSVARQRYYRALQAAQRDSWRWQQQHLTFLIGYTLADERQFSESNHWLETAWGLRDPNRPTHLDAMIQENLGGNRQKQGDLHPALQHYHLALQLHSTIEYPEGIATAANNLATLYQESGNSAAALVYYRQCLAALEPGNRNVPIVENNIAECLLALHQVQEAETILAKPLLSGSAAYFQRLSLRQQHLRLINETDQAAILATSALQQAMRTRNPEFVSDALCDILRVSSSGAEASRLMSETIPLLPENDPNHWQIRLLLAQLHYRERNFTAVEQSARDAFSYLRQYRLGSDFEFNFAARVLQVVRLWTAALAQQGKSYRSLTVWEMGKSFARGKPAPSLHAFQQRLGPDCAAIDFCVTSHQTIVWVMRQHTLECLVLNTPESTLADHIDSLLGPLASTTNLLSTGFNRQVANTVYRNLIQPLEIALRGANCWTILPDSKLHAVPFEMLEDNSGTPLLERAVIRYWDALHAADSTPQALQRLTAWLDGPIDDSHFLPADTRVVRTWADVLRTEGDTLHYAGHSLLDETFPALSTLTASDRITARQIAQARLTYRLIVLSSCESAGEIGGFGSGLLGLTAAFQSAGARQIIATLWPIDQRSSLLLEEFYRLPLRESALAQNFRRARLEFRRNSYRAGSYSVSMSNPYFWAPYILIAPHYPHPRQQRTELISFLIPLAMVTTRCCARRRVRPKQ